MNTADVWTNAGFRQLPPLSVEQSILMDHIKQMRGNVFCNSYAGSGKTTSNEHAIRILPSGSQVLYLVFATKNAKEFRAKNGMGEKQKNVTLPNGVELQVDTCHAFGYSQLRKARRYLKVDKNKSYAIAERIGIPEEYHGFCAAAVKHAKSRLFGLLRNIDDKEAWYEIVNHFDLDDTLESNSENGNGEEVKTLDAMIAEAVGWSIRLLRASRAEKQIIDFDDQIYEPLVGAMKFDQFDYVLLDEAQDSDEGKRALVRAALKPGGLAMFVGDRFQAIMGFAGADNDAVDKIIRDFNCTELSLSVSFRCSKAVVREAQKICPQIKSADWAVEGTLHDDMTHEQMMSLAKTLTHEDVILCRKTAPLIETAFALIKQGVACYVEGRDLGAQILQLVNKWKRIKTIDKLKIKLEDYRETMTARYMAKKQEDKADSLNDRIDSLLVLMEGCDTLQCVRDKINAMFNDDEYMPRKLLTLSTVHKSKGREWSRVFVLGFHQYMPSKYARQQWQQYQEQCLIYVAQTRSKDQLFYVSDRESNGRAKPVSA